MAWVKGPNRVVTYVPDEVAKDLVGDGDRGYEYAPDPTVKETLVTPPRKRTPRKTTAK